MRQAFIIWKKEVKDTIRDRRTLISMVVIPILIIPLILVGMSKIFETLSKQQEKENSKVSIQNGDKAPVLVEAIKKQKNIEIKTIDKPLKDAIRNNEIDIGIVIPEDFQDQLDLQNPVQLKELTISTNDQSFKAASRVSLGVAEFNNNLLQERFASKGVEPSILTNVVEVPEDVATQKEQQGLFLGGILPLLIIMYAILGGQFTAIDVSAGEKERKTLEALLLAPIKRSSVVIGKFLAVSTVALFSIIIALVSIYLSISYLASTAAGQTGQKTEFSALNIDPQAFLLITLVSLLLVIMFSAILLSVGIFAKSFKEAQSYMNPVLFIALIPLILASLAQGVKPSIYIFTIPAVNANFLLKELFIGTYDLSHIAVTLVSLGICALMAVVFATYIYSKEDILFES